MLSFPLGSLNIQVALLYGEGGDALVMSGVELGQVLPKEHFSERFIHCNGPETPEISFADQFCVCKSLVKNPKTSNMGQYGKSNDQHEDFAINQI